MLFPRILIFALLPELAQFLVVVPVTVIISEVLSSIIEELPQITKLLPVAVIMALSMVENRLISGKFIYLLDISIGF